MSYMSSFLSWINPLNKIVTGIYDLANPEQARDRIYFNEVYRKHILEVIEKKKSANCDYKNMTKEEFMEEYYKTDISKYISLVGFNEEDRVTQEAVRNVTSHHAEEFRKLYDGDKHKELNGKIREWYGEHLYKDYKERTWDGIAFNVIKGIRG